MDVRALRRHPAVSGFAAWTLFVWGNRVWLAWTDPTLSTGEKLTYSVPITLFVLAALVVLVAVLRGVEPTRPALRRLIEVFFVGTVAYWGVRLPLILAHDHPVPFKAVHTVLAVVSAVLGFYAARAARRPSADRTSRPAARISA